MRLAPSCRLLLSLLLATNIFSAAPAQAQSTAEPPAKTVHVTVVDHAHRPMTGLKADDFTVYKDNRPQLISKFSSDVPACIGLLIDRSGSMRGKHPAIASAMAELVRAGNPESRVFVVTFNDDPMLERDFTHDAALVEQAILRAEARGGTAMYDSIIASADHLAETQACSKRVLLVVSDGQDNESRKTLDYTVNALRNDGNPLVYAIRLEHSNGPSKRAQQILDALVKPSGGAAYFAGDMGELRKIALRMAQEIRSQYTLTYAAAGPPDKGEVRVEAHLGGGKDITVRTNIAAEPAPRSVTVAAPPPTSQGPACISGSVVDQDKKPLPEILVEALPTFRSNPYPQNVHPSSVTDEQGNFKIAGLPSGRYRLITKMESETLPGAALVYHGQDFPAIQSADQCANVALTFFTNLVRLRIDVVDAASRAPIANHGLMLSRPGGYPMPFPHADPKVPMLVPAHMELTIQAWSHGYDRSRPVTITTGDADAPQQITIELDAR